MKKFQKKIFFLGGGATFFWLSLYTWRIAELQLRYIGSEALLVQLVRYSVDERATFKDVDDADFSWVRSSAVVAAVRLERAMHDADRYDVGKRRTLTDRHRWPAVEQQDTSGDRLERLEQGRHSQYPPHDAAVPPSDVTRDRTWRHRVALAWSAVVDRCSISKLKLHSDRRENQRDTDLPDHTVWVNLLQPDAAIHVVRQFLWVLYSYHVVFI